ncbi:cysteine desulfurase [Pelagirhabdus alkalitolerans]|uniref:cysteine desulfurase n=1 Tax=Pelagirhabdus alkalitolerans TaxID=1612202 RepID=A0A1G6HSB8_9BACI|nr:cysteine desulfurase family protein [Pelagirhabdus alkalitolerans]SDB97038.1 cysteine desulfurase [Pelagirhabdus alkalitolerans]
MKEPIYLDHAATTPMHEEVIDAVSTCMRETFGNPSSIHQYGRQSRRLLDEARRTLANSIHAKEKDVYFTSGGTEADNLAVIGTALANRDKGNHIITSKVEHHAVLHAAEYLETIGFDVTYLPVDENGIVDVSTVASHLRDDTILVSVMMVNNEVGAIQPIREIGQLLNEHQAYFHTDAVQAYGLLPIDVTDLMVDLLTVSAHKINGPKGVGFLYSQPAVSVQPHLFGGSQERLKRPGTEALPLIKGMEKAVSLFKNDLAKEYEAYRTLFLDQLNTLGVKYSINGNLENASPAIVNLSFDGMNVESLLMNFDLEGIAASSGSACTAGSIESSHVLSAMYEQNDERLNSAIRFSFGLANNEGQIKEAAKRIANVISRLQ